MTKLHLTPSGRVAWKWIAFIAAVLLVTAGILVSISVKRARLTGEIDAKMRELRQQGVLIGVHEINTWYHQNTAKDNAADVLKQVFRIRDEQKDEEIAFPVNTDNDGSAELPLIGVADGELASNPLPADLQQKVAAYLEKRAKTLQLLHQAAAMRECRYPIDWTRGMQTLLPHLSGLQSSCKLLCLAAHHYAQQGDADAALQALTTCWRLLKTIQSEPALISQLVCCSCDKTWLLTMSQVMSMVRFQDEQLRALADMLATDNANARQNTQYAQMGELAMVLDAFAMMKSDERRRNELGKDAPSRLAMLLYEASCVWEEDMLWYVNLWHANYTAGGRSWPEYVKAWQETGKKSNAIPPEYIISRLLSPASSAFLRPVETIAIKRSALAVLAAKRHQLASGQFPDSLKVLVPDYLPDVPQDPFGDNKSLHYKKAGDGCLVYSVGQNGKDDGGDSQKEDGCNKDLVYNVTR